MRTSINKFMALCVFISCLLFVNGNIAPQLEANGRQAFIPRVPETLIKQTVRVQWGKRDGLGGSGVVIGDHAVLTAYHVVDKAPGGDPRTPKDVLRIYVEVKPGKFKRGTMIVGDSKADLAILHVNHTFEQVADILDEDYMSAGDPLWCIGYPMGVELPAISFGYLSGLEWKRKNDFNVKGLWQASCPAFFGNSGGPIFDANTYELIGIVHGGIGRLDGGMAANVVVFQSYKPITRIVRAFQKLKQYQ